METVVIPVFIFSDMDKLEATLRIEVTPLPVMYCQTQAGAQQTLTLALPVKSSSIVRLFSSCRQNAYLPLDKRRNQFTVIPNTINHIPMCVKTFNPAEKRVVVNAIGK